LIRTNTSQYTHDVGSETAITSLSSFPGAARTPAGQVCQSGATSLGSCQFRIEEGLVTTIASAAGLYARIQVWRANRTNTTARTCGGDSGGTVYQHFSGGGESILGVVSTAYGPDAGTVKGAPCTTGFGFTFWGQGRAVYPGYTPLIN
jgi:hypothetical protein